MHINRIILALIASLWAGLASAGDAARLNVLGFSANGEIFAFEQYGIQDGSGFAYAERFYINTHKDSFISGTPIRVRLDDEMASLNEARAQAKTQAENITNTADTNLSMSRATIAASHSITQINGNPHFMQFTPRAIFPPIDAPLALQLIAKDVPSRDLCQELQAQKGFKLLLSNVETGSAWNTLNDDQTLPQSRGCPLGYRLHQAITYYPAGATPILVVIIAIRSFGFEGPDHRYMAITHQLDG